MSDPEEIANLRAQVEQLSAENNNLREGGFRGSKAEALMALEYDRIPNVMKTPRAIALQRKVATLVMIAVPIILLAVVVIGGISTYRDHERSMLAQKEWSELGASIRHDVQKELNH